MNRYFSTKEGKIIEPVNEFVHQFIKTPCHVLSILLVDRMTKDEVLKFLKERFFENKMLKPAFERTVKEVDNDYLWV